MVETQSGIVLTDEQEAAVDTLVHSKVNVQTLGGLAGTGKSTIVRHLLKRLPNFAVCAYTGKAAQVLRRKGVHGASTIHSLIYYYDRDEGRFSLKPGLPVDGVIVDEASMLGRSLYDDLRSFDLPLIFVGDHGQLEPVGEQSFNLMADPDITLETIHRNAGEIARFANWLRQGNSAASWEPEDVDEAGGNQVSVISSEQLTDEVMSGVDQVICAYNQTRVEINETFREHLGYDGGPRVGDRVMCLQNDAHLKVFNGMQGVLKSIDRRSLTVEVDGVEFRCPYQPDAFGAAQKPGYQRGVIPFDYAYCVTCHKCQGDEFDNVLVVEQRCAKWDHQRWSYTAASRAKNRLTWIME